MARISGLAESAVLDALREQAFGEPIDHQLFVTMGQTKEGVAPVLALVLSIKGALLGERITTPAFMTQDLFPPKGQIDQMVKHAVGALRQAKQQRLRDAMTPAKV